MVKSATKRNPHGLATLLKFRRSSLKLTLQDVSNRADAEGEPLPVSTLWRIERGRLEPGARRLHLLLRIYGIEPSIASELATLEEGLGPLPTGDVETLYRAALSSWKRGDAKETLAYIFAILIGAGEKPGARETHAALIFSATVARGLGKLGLARHMIDQVLCGGADDDNLSDALTLAASLWRESGAVAVAMAMVREAKEHVAPHDRRRRGQLLHQEAKILMELKRPKDAQAALDSAIEDYRAIGHSLNEAKALVLRIAVMEKVTSIDAAIEAAREAIRFAEERGHELLKANGLLELGRVLLEAGRPNEAVVELTTALELGEQLGNDPIQKHAREWITKARGGSPSRR